jgi:hypothetical protein
MLQQSPAQYQTGNELKLWSLNWRKHIVVHNVLLNNYDKEFTYIVVMKLHFLMSFSQVTFFINKCPTIFMLFYIMLQQSPALYQTGNELKLWSLNWRKHTVVHNVLLNDYDKEFKYIVVKKLFLSNILNIPFTIYYPDVFQSFIHAKHSMWVLNGKQEHLTRR